MKAHTPIFVVALALAIAGCGSDSGTSAAKQEPSGGNTAQTSDDDDDAAPSSDDDDDAAASSNDNDAQAPAGSAMWKRATVASQPFRKTWPTR